MSFIIGKWQKYAPNFPQSFATLYEGIKVLPHQKYDTILLENTGLGRALVFDTPEAIFDTMPCHIKSKHLLFTAIGRLDNRKELQAALKLSNNDIADTTLMLEAYLRWGKETPNKLLGDWLFATYNEQTQEFFIARDQYGSCCLFYTFDHNHFQFSSSKKSFLGLDNFSRKINIEHFLYYFAAYDSGNMTDTPFEGLHYLPTAHTLTYKNGQVKLEPYWFPENISLRRYKDRRDYEEELREILTVSVEARLRSYKPVVSTLSGGLDSSSVSSLAARSLAAQNQRLTTLSHVPFFVEEIKNIERKYVFQDESDHILATAQHHDNIDARLLRTTQISVLEGMTKLMDVSDDIVPAPCNAYWVLNIFKTAQQEDFGTLLMASCGNVALSYDGLVYQQSLKQLYQQRGLYGMVRTGILKPFVYKYFPSQNAIKKDYIDYIQNNSYLNTDLVKEWRLIEHIKNQKAGFAAYIPDAKSDMLNGIENGKSYRCLTAGEASNYFGISHRDPTADIRVFEYCLSVPNDVFIGKDGTRRQLIRNMMRGYVPDKVLNEKRTGFQASDIYFRVMSEKGVIEDLLEEVIHEPTLQYFYNIQKLKQDWKDFKGSRPEAKGVLNIFLQSLMFGIFLKKYKLYV